MSWFRNSRYATEDTVVIGNCTYLFFFFSTTGSGSIGKEGHGPGLCCAHTQRNLLGYGPSTYCNAVVFIESFFLLFYGHFLMVIRSWWNLCQRWLHSKEADAPDGSAAHSDPRCPQVRLGVRWDGWGIQFSTWDVTEVKSHLMNR